MKPLSRWVALTFVTAWTLAPSTVTTQETDGKDWVRYGLTTGETRFSPLDQINAGNVSRLGLAWHLDVGMGGGGQEATPLVRNGVIYSITNWSIVFAVDARTGKELWRWDPEVNQTAVRPKICCGVVNRGLALYEDLVIAPIIDGRLEGINAKTGKVVWEARVGFPQEWATITMAPRLAGDKVVIGVSGGDRPMRGYFDAYDARTGRRVWRFYTVPGNPALGFENEAMRQAADTWGGNWWQYGGGGAVWDGAAYDPEANLVYVGTGNAEPWTQIWRGATGLDNLFTCAIVAVDADTGEYRWHYQVVPNDNWDYDSVQQLMLVNLMMDGVERKVVMQASKNGFYYVIDRLTGAFISAEPFARVTWASGIDGETGRPVVHPQSYYGTTPVTLSPNPGGAHNWSPMSYNPATGLVYIPTTTRSSFTFAAVEEFTPAPGQTTGTVRPAPAASDPGLPAIGPEPIEGTRTGALVAWDPLGQQMRWRRPGGGGIGGGTVTTAGNLVFQVVNDGRLLAYTADTGELRLEIQTNLGAGMGPPITYLVDGRQYVTLMGGIGQTSGNAGPGNQTTTSSPPRMLTFVLDGKAEIPAAPEPEAPKDPPAAGAPPVDN
ncbi:MAG TPA: PQQ-dependent dehydrogenase, methanol/ethanol family [Vicinamibacterales bacterium]|jgi:PQQ-dependent dehydrogenase (methanol/ethanol family)|nr:PQQ-dependent dehydrogenase, methanol/ethanol family [Vicinamibacterales bacterium]